MKRDNPKPMVGMAVNGFGRHATFTEEGWQVCRFIRFGLAVVRRSH